MAESLGGGAGEALEGGGVEEGGEHHFVVAAVVVLEVGGGEAGVFGEEGDVAVEGGGEEGVVAPQRLHGTDLLLVDLDGVLEVEGGGEEGDVAVAVGDDDPVGLGGGRSTLLAM